MTTEPTRPIGGDHEPRWQDNPAQHPNLARQALRDALDDYNNATGDWPRHALNLIDAAARYIDAVPEWVHHLADDIDVERARVATGWSDDYAVDEDARVSPYETGRWVQVWVDIENPECSECSTPLGEEDFTAGASVCSDCRQDAIDAAEAVERRALSSDYNRRPTRPY